MLFGQYNSDWSKILAILILALLPVIIVYVFMQKYIVKGVSEGAIKSWVKPLSDEMGKDYEISTTTPLF